MRLHLLRPLTPAHGPSTLRLRAPHELLLAQTLVGRVGRLDGPAAKQTPLLHLSRTASTDPSSMHAMRIVAPATALQHLLLMVLLAELHERSR
jgi:hypothetical protein